VTQPASGAAGPEASTVTDASLLRLRDDLAVEGAAVRRQTARDLRDRAAELATWTGTLRDLAERGDAVVLHLEGGATRRGWLRAIGLDHLAITTEVGGTALVALASVRAVRPEPGVIASAATGDRAGSQDRTLLEAIQAFVLVGDPLVVGVRDVAVPLQGRLLGLGEDVLTLRVATDPGGVAGTVYVPEGAIREVVLP
jgi:hypothetical protein